MTGNTSKPTKMFREKGDQDETKDRRKESTKNKLLRKVCEINLVKETPKVKRI
jgi:hypothetical protein